MDLQKYYQERQGKAFEGSNRTKKKILHTSLLRLIIFIAGFITSI